MKNKIKKYLKEIIFFSLMLFLASNAMSLFRSSDLNQAPLDLKTVKLINNQEYTIDTTKPIMIHFWATWCPICKVEASNIQKISEHFQVLSIATQSGSDEDIKKYQQENKVNFKVINDKDGLISKHIGIGAFPTTLIYDKNKNIVFSDVGYTSTLALWFKMLWAK